MRSGVRLALVLAVRSLRWVPAAVLVVVAGLLLAPGDTRVSEPDLPADERAAARLVDAHNHGWDMAALAEADASAADVPGLVGGGPAPRLGEFLAWSQVVYRIDPAGCSLLEPERVACPDARWSGPLVEGLAMPPVPQPVSFVFAGGRVVAVDGGTAPGLAHAYDRYCRWVRDHRPEVVPFVFDGDGCRPIFTELGAGRLLLTLADYKADAR